MSRRLYSTSLYVWGSVFVLCVSSRLLTTIYYIEDIDSLRFALSLVTYDVGNLQPHFPAYPVFCFLVKIAYVLTGRYAIAFSLLGGVSTFLIIFFTLKIARVQYASLLGKLCIFIVFMVPLLWLMSNRYMPDIMGVACLLASLYYITISEKNNRRTLLYQNTVGFLLAGILMGIKASYIPFLLPALFICLISYSGRLKKIIAGIIGVFVWLIPLICLTGWTDLITAAQKQSYGHFADFGGAVSTDPEFMLRVSKMVESIVADGFGLYWLGRHPITAACTVFLIAIILIYIWYVLSRMEVAALSEYKAILRNPIFLGTVSYCLWIFIGQNIIYKSRHVLPILPICAIGIAFCCYQFIMNRKAELTNGSRSTQDGRIPPACGGIKGGKALKRTKTRVTHLEKDKTLNKNIRICVSPGTIKRRLLTWGPVIIFLICYSYVSLHTVIQHTQPTAIAQVHRYLHDRQLESRNNLTIVSVPLIKYYLVSQDVTANYITIEDETDLALLDDIKTGLVVIGSPLPNRTARDRMVFYHNPYVNRMWSELSVYAY